MICLSSITMLPFSLSETRSRLRIFWASVFQRAYSFYFSRKKVRTPDAVGNPNKQREKAIEKSGLRALYFRPRPLFAGLTD